MIMESTELAEYTTASQLAVTYRIEIETICAALATIKESLDRLNDQFKPDTYHRFELDVAPKRWSGRASSIEDPKTIPALIDQYHRDAWRVIVDKLNVRKLMSSKRSHQLDELLEKGKVEIEDGTFQTLPPLTEQNILAIIQSFVDNAESFLVEAVREEYDYWKPGRGHREYKTNQQHAFKLEKKLIKGYAFRTWSYGGTTSIGGMNQDTQKHLCALDNIMHLLDGKGQVKGWCGPAVDAINTANQNRIMSAETDYFKIKWFNNGNMHLEFKRLDLLDKFNEICSTNSIPHDSKKKAKTDGHRSLLETN